MPKERSRPLLMLDYERTAREYFASLPLEHFMEGTSQATQRLITLVAFEQVHARRADVQPFNELLIQYDHGRPPKRRQVVPDNMVVVHPEPIKAKGSYDVPLQPVKPFFVLEYVSPGNPRKDYGDSHDKYEKELKIPYYLIFYADNEELTLFHHNGRKYVSVKPDERQRYTIPELELEIGLVDGWVRFWFRGERLEMPSQLREERDAARARTQELEAELEMLRQQLQQQGGQAPS
jgi:hypothetical protein